MLVKKIKYQYLIMSPMLCRLKKQNMANFGNKYGFITSSHDCIGTCTRWYI